MLDDIHIVIDADIQVSLKDDDVVCDINVQILDDGRE